MSARTVFALLLLTVNSIAATGCGGETARSAQSTQSQLSPAAPPSKQTETSLPSAHAHRRTDTPHEAFLSTYHHPEQGISFRYPRNYSLEEGDLEEHSFFLKRQEDLDLEQPGATLLATVLIPEDGYPNTTFEHGSAQLLVNETGTEKACRETSPLASGGNTVKRLTPGGITFRGSEQESKTAGTKILERAYYGFSAGSCYEFLLTVATEDTPDPDGFNRAADTTKIMNQLEKIVSSAQIFTKSAPLAENNEKSTRRL
jgi:hypothetical protein